jgi:hypothetical protein
MDLITPTEVVRRIESYFQGGAAGYLSRRQFAAAQRGTQATAANPYDRRALTRHSAGMACESFIQSIPEYPGGYEGRGIVICGGGARYLPGAWVTINMLRRLGCRLPIQLWHLGKKEMDSRMQALLAPLGVECVDAFEVRKKIPVRILKGWELKAYAILHSSFSEVLLLDADNVPVENPEFLFDTPQFQTRGAIFWPDYEDARNPKARPVWRSCGLRPPAEQEFESGQMMVSKPRCWRALCLSLWFNENSDFYYQYVHGDKETFHLAFRKMRQRYFLVPKPVHPLEATMCQHEFDGRRIFQHRNRDKWILSGRNKRIQGFWFERECRGYLAQLRRAWHGLASGPPTKPEAR